MPIALRGTPILIRFPGAGSNSVDISSLGIQAGDLIIVGACSGAAGSTDSAAPTCTANVSGALTNDSDLFASDTDSTNAWSWHKIATGADTSLSVTSLPSGAMNYAVWAYSGVNATTPLDVAVTTATGINTDLADPAAITPVTQGAKILAFYMAAQTTQTAWTDPTNLVNFNQIHQGVGCIGAGDIDWSSGSFDPAAVTGGVTTTKTSCSWAAVTYAIRPRPSNVSVYWF